MVKSKRVRIGKLDGERFFLKTRRSLYREDELRTYRSLGFAFKKTPHGFYLIKNTRPVFVLDSLETLLAMVDGLGGVCLEKGTLTILD